MATIRTAIQITDGMSPAFRSMNNAMNIVLSSFESIQRASGNAIDTSSIQAARQELSNAESSFNQVEESIRNSNQQQQRFNNSIRDGTNATNGLIRTAKNLFATYLGIKTLGNVVNTSDELVQTKARLDMINDGLQTTDQLQNMIFQSAQRSRAVYSDTANAVAQLGTRAKDAFSSNQEVIAFSEVLNKMFTIAGAGQQEMNSATLQLTQALGSGILRGEELNAVFEAAPNIMQAVAEYMGKPIGKLRDMASDGKISADIVKKAMFAAAEETNTKFESMPKTISQIWTSIKNNALMEFQPVLLKINEIANNPNFNTLVTNVVNGIATIANVTLGLIETICNVSAFFSNNWGIIGPIIYGIVAALVIYKGAMIASAIATGISSLANSIYAVGAYNACASLAATELAIYGKVSAQTLEAMTTASATAAQWGFNAALLACPITWIIVAIIAVIAIFYVVIGVINKVKGTSISATGIIAGVFFTLGAYLYNIIAYVWNYFASLAEFLLNVFNNPVYSIKALFANLAINVIDACISMTSGFDDFATSMANAIIDGVNIAIRAWNSFMDILPDSVKSFLHIGVGTEFGHTASITSDLQSAKSSIQDWLGDKPEDYIEIPKMEMKSIGGAFDSGYDLGKGLVDNVKGASEENKNDDSGFNYDELLKNAEASSPNIADTAKNTGAMKDKLDITDEDLKYLRDIAEQEVINRFTTAEIKIEMNNNNTINNEMDLDGIVDHLSEKVYEEMSIAAEGVHDD